MKVLVLPSWYKNKINPQRGIFFEEQTRGLLNKGVKADICYLDTPNIKQFLKDPSKILFKKVIENDRGLLTYRINGINLFNIKSEFGRKSWVNIFFKLVESYLKKEGMPDVIHAHSYHSGIVADRIKKKYGINYILTEHSSAIFNKKYDNWEHKLISDAYKNANLLICVSNSLKNALLNKFNTINIDPIVMPNFIDTSYFKPDFNNDIQDNKIILNIGNLIPVKNQKSLILGFLNSRAIKNGWTLKIIGEGLLRKELQELISTHNSENNIKLLGRLNRASIKKELNSANFFAFSSIKETFGVVLIEALSMGLPILSTKCGGSEDIVTDDVGKLIENNSIEAITNGINDMISKYKQYSNKEVREYCLNKYSVEVNVNELIKIYNKNS